VGAGSITKLKYEIRILLNKNKNKIEPLVIAEQEREQEQSESSLIETHDLSRINASAGFFPVFLVGFFGAWKVINSY